MSGVGRFLVVASGLIATLALTLWVFGLPVASSLGLIADGALGDRFGMARTLVKTTPLVLTSLGILIAWRAGMYNIGGEGQFVMGAIAGAAMAKVASGLAPAVLNLAILIVCAAAGSTYAALAGWLAARRGVNVVVSTILLNFIAFQALSWAVTGPLQERKGQLPLSEPLPDEAMLLRFDRQLDLHTGVFIAVAMAVLVHVFLFLSRAGFRLRLVGESPRAARAARHPVTSTQVLAMGLSGGLCGLAAGVEYTGMTGQIGVGFAQGWGFLAIPAALLGNLHPIGVTLSSLYFGGLFAGSGNLARFGGAAQTLVYVIQGVAVLGLIAVLETLRRRAQPPPDEETP